MHLQLIRKYFFIIGLLGICLFYFCFELFFNAYSLLSVDDFWFTHAIYKYKNNLPYRDFAPYKTVLGYYLLLLPLLFSHGIISTFIFLKNMIAAINTLIFFFSAFWLTRFFPKLAILCSLLVLLTAEVVLSYSTSIRMDLLAYWFCFFSLLLLLDKRYFSAGILLGLGFLTSQKAIWYIFASHCALFFSWLLASANEKIIWNTFKFNFSLLITIVVYLLFWSFFANWHTVIHSVFYEAAAMYRLDAYESSRLLFWSDITKFNPLLFFLIPLTLISLFVSYTAEKNYARRVFVTIYANSIFFCLIPYKQVFPYYIQVLFPVLLVANAAFFGWLFTIFRQQHTLKILFIGKKGLWLLIYAYIGSVIYFKDVLQWPSAYFLICSIPLLIGLYITNKTLLTPMLTSLFLNLIFITMLFIGFIYPSILYSMRLLSIAGAYQKENVFVANALLKEGGDYIAGVDLFYNKIQAIEGLRHLMFPAIAYLASPNEKLRAVMLPALDENPEVTVGSIMTALKESRVKFYVNNYRILSLPESLRNYLASQYEHYWGSIYLYAPRISAGRQNIMIKFSGKYQVESGDKIKLNKKEYKPNHFIYLKVGHYISRSRKVYRLKLIPELPITLNSHYQDDYWPLLVF